MARKLTHPETGETASYKDWATKLETSIHTIYARVNKYGNNDLRVFTKGKLQLKFKTLTHPQTGETYTYKDWASKLEISVPVLTTRIYKLGPNNLKVFSPRRKLLNLTHPTTKENLSIEDWAIKLNVTVTALRYRVRKYGTNNIKIFTPQVTLTHPITNETLTIPQWAIKLGISRQAMHRRIIKYDSCSAPCLFVPNQNPR